MFVYIFVLSCKNETRIEKTKQNQEKKDIIVNQTERNDTSYVIMDEKITELTQGTLFSKDRFEYALLDSAIILKNPPSKLYFFTNNVNGKMIFWKNKSLTPKFVEKEKKFHLFELDGWASGSVFDKHDHTTWNAFKFIRDYFNTKLSNYQSPLNDTIEMRFHVNVENKISGLRVYCHYSNCRDSIVINVARNCIRDLEKNSSFIQSESNKGTDQIHKLFLVETKETSIDYLELENDLIKSGLSEKKKRELFNKYKYVLMYR